MLTDKVTLNYKLQLRPSAETNNGEQHEDVNEPVCVPANKFQLVAEENCYYSSENVATQPTNTTPSEQLESSGRWTQRSEQSISVSSMFYI